jgi:hypothetical protein
MPWRSAKGTTRIPLALRRVDLGYQALSFLRARVFSFRQFSPEKYVIPVTNNLHRENGKRKLEIMHEISKRRTVKTGKFA